MHTQTDTAQVITSAGGDYVFTVKGNQPTLHAACKRLPWTRVPAHSVVTTGHGRRARRTIKVITAPAWVDFPGAAQVAQVRRSVTRAGKKTVEVVYLLITSADYQAAPPATLAAWVQGTGGSRTNSTTSATSPSTKTGPRSASAAPLASWPPCRSTAIGLLRLTGWTNIAAGLRHHARDPEHPTKLMLTC